MKCEEKDALNILYFSIVLGLMYRIINQSQRVLNLIYFFYQYIGAIGGDLSYGYENVDKLFNIVFTGLVSAFPSVRMLVCLSVR